MEKSKEKEEAIETIKENIEMQLAEVELLQSMYPGEHEFKLNDVAIINDLKLWLENDQKLGENFIISPFLVLVFL